MTSSGNPAFVPLPIGERSDRAAIRVRGSTSFAIQCPLTLPSPRGGEETLAPDFSALAK